MWRAIQTPAHTPRGARGISTIEVSRLAPSIRPSHAYGTHLDKFTAAKKTAMVAVNVTGGSRNGSTYALNGGLPAWATKLVKPEATPNAKPTRRDGGGASERGGNTRRWPRKSSVSAPTTAATMCCGTVRKRIVP